MSDILVRGSSTDGAIRVFVTITTDLVNEAQRIHKTYSTATAALGRVLTVSAIIGAGMKNDTDSTTIQFKGDGPIGRIVAVCNNKSLVWVYFLNQYVDIPRKKNGKLDVGAA
ncbi:MAG: Hsp33 family molecular chaperone HslO, partial [Clostridia bacterium]|nr:Hsp33 family molecular chaperone HslO [Clostridia bacterium]